VTLLCSDGQSWIAHVWTGPLVPAVWSPLIWAKLAQLAEIVHQVFVRFVFAHCDDPRGDVVAALTNGYKARK
jgi:hypothetical protein